jgi:hypothetical protein
MTVRTPPESLLATLAGTDGQIKYVSLERAEAQGLVDASRIPLTLKILVEAALRHADDPRRSISQRLPSAHGAAIWIFGRPACCCRISPASRS